MATKEITKRASQYPDPELEPQLISVPVDDSRERGAILAKIALLWDRRGFIFRCAAIGLIASAIIALLIPVRYTSTTRLMPPDQPGQGLTSILASVGKATGDSSLTSMSGLKTSGDLFVGVLQSRSVEDDLINKFDLRKVYGVRRYQDARKVLAARTDISADRKSGIITMMISDGNAERAAAMGREYVVALNGIVINLNTSSAHKERAFLEERIGQVKQDLEQAEKDFSQFASKNTALDVKEQGRAMIGAAAEVEGQLIAAQTELEGLRQMYTESNVRVRSVQARVNEYRRQLQKMGGKDPSGAESDPSQNPTGTGQNVDPYPSIRELPLLNVAWSDLYRRTKVEEAVFETLTKQYELAKVEEARETPSVRVLDPADVPEAKSFPPRTILVIVATGLLTLFGIVWILVQARWQEIDPSDPAKALSEEIYRSIRTTVARVGTLGRRGEQDSGERE